MRITIVSTQRPGYGGAATSAYEAIKHLRRLGHDVTGLFIDHCGDPECQHSGAVPHGPADPWYDPDGISGVNGVGTCKARESSDWLPQDSDVVVGKNYGAAALVGAGCRCPTVYWTSGVPELANIAKPFVEYSEPLDRTRPDIQAIAATTITLVHSSLVLDHYRRVLTPDLRHHLVEVIVPTPDMVPLDSMPDRIPYMAREYDAVMIASEWGRTVKNPWLAKYTSLALGRAGERVAVIGGGWRHPSRHETHHGLVSHARALDVLADSRVLVIPSYFDASPNVYTEAIALGCNVVVSPNVGNCWDHPTETMAPTLDPNNFAWDTVLRAVSLEDQLPHRRIDPDGTATAMVSVLQAAIARWHDR